MALKSLPQLPKKDGDPQGQRKTEDTLGPQVPGKKGKNGKDKTEEQKKKARAANNAAAVRYRLRIKQSHDRLKARAEQLFELIGFCDVLDDAYKTTRGERNELQSRVEELEEQNRELRSIMASMSRAPANSPRRSRRLLSDENEINRSVHYAFSV